MAAAGNAANRLTTTAAIERGLQRFERGLERVR